MSMRMSSPGRGLCPSITASTELLSTSVSGRMAVSAADSTQDCALTVEQRLVEGPSADGVVATRLQVERDTNQRSAGRSPRRPSSPIRGCAITRAAPTSSNNETATCDTSMFRNRPRDPPRGDRSSFMFPQGRPWNCAAQDETEGE